MSCAQRPAGGLSLAPLRSVANPGTLHLRGTQGLVLDASVCPLEPPQGLVHTKTPPGAHHRDGTCPRGTAVFLSAPFHPQPLASCTHWSICPPQACCSPKPGLVRDTEAGTALGAAALIGCLLLGPLPPPAWGPCLSGPCWSPRSSAPPTRCPAPCQPVSWPRSCLLKRHDLSPVPPAAPPPAWHHFQTPHSCLLCQIPPEPSPQGNP